MTELLPLALSPDRGVSMDGLIKAVEAADSIWPVVAIGLIGIYVLLWRYGGLILTLLREARHAAEQASTKTDEIQASIVTNHGSKNIGDAVDKLTESVQDLRAELIGAVAVLNHRVTNLEQRKSDAGQ